VRDHALIIRHSLQINVQNLALKLVAAVLLLLLLLSHGMACSKHWLVPHGQ
jgi:hypothetical protein